MQADGARRYQYNPRLQEIMTFLKALCTIATACRSPPAIGKIWKSTPTTRRSASISIAPARAPKPATIPLAV